MKNKCSCIDYEKCDITDETEISGHILFPKINGQFLEACPVLYMFHGTGGVQEWFASDKMDLINNLKDWINREGNEISPMIVVLPCIEIPTSGSKATPFWKFNKKIPYLIDCINRKYANNVKTGQRNTAIAGFSMGAAASLYYAQENPGCFYHFGAFSPGPALYTSWLKDKSLSLPALVGSHNLIGRGELENSSFIKTTTKCINDLKALDVPLYSNNAVIIQNHGHDSSTFVPLLKQFILQNIFKEN